jgi:glycosyltransferase involved in cell wall biosynthesis
MLSYDIIHIHWPEIYLSSNYFVKAFLGSFLLLASFVYAKLCGKKIIWTVHNLKPHKVLYPRLNSIFWWSFYNIVDGVVSLSKSNELKLQHTTVQSKKWKKKIVYHGLYTDIYENTVDKVTARSKLLIDKNANVYLFLGLIRPYKNIETLINIFNSDDMSINNILLIAGNFESNVYYQAILKLANNNPKIIIHNNFIDDSDLQTYYNAADITVLPFKNIFNSGSALLSISFNKKILVPYSDNFAEYNEFLGGNILMYTSELTSSDLLEVDFNFNTKAVSPCLELKWSRLQKSLSDFYLEVIR